MLNLSIENILHSNVFNFTVMIIIFAFLAHKLNLAEAIEKNKQNIVSTVNNSVETKNQSHAELKKVEDVVKNTASEIEAIVVSAKSTLKTIEQKITADAQKQVKSVENNVVKVVDSEVSRLNSRLAKGVSNASVALAESNMKKLLLSNSDLHKKFIYDSIDELDKVEI